MLIDKGAIRLNSNYEEEDQRKKWIGVVKMNRYKVLIRVLCISNVLFHKKILIKI